ncbi:MAG TPA: nucleotidyl transferase AbiEii/AbiGii toxin family protein [Hanamia sp.]
MQVSVKEKIKNTKTNIDSAFLKSETIWKELVLEDVIPQVGLSQRPDIKIKLEVDTRPPLGFNTEEKLLLKPFSFYVKCFTLEDLFAGKMHALLFRNWKQRVKGRDWFDMEWYIKKGIPLNLQHFLIRARGSENWDEKTISKEQFLQLLNNKITSVSFNSVKADIVRFISDNKVLDIWSAQYFNDLIEQMKFKK